MSISFIRVDDRMIHGQTCTRWALEYPCDGLIAVNDKAATTPVLKAAYKNASDKKTFVWTLDEWRAKCGKVLASKDRYFLITKDPITMKSILVDDGFDPGEDDLVLGGDVLNELCKVCAERVHIHAVEQAGRADVLAVAACHHAERVVQTRSKGPVAD